MAQGEIGMTFGKALKEIQNGSRCARAGWNGKGMWIFWSTVTFAVTANGQTIEPKDPYPCLVMKAADDRLVFGWLASQTDMQATDWIDLGPMD